MIRVKRLDGEAQLPLKAHDTDAGYDLFSREDKVIVAGTREVIKTGISIELPNLGNPSKDLYLQITSREEMNLKKIDIIPKIINRTSKEEITILLVNNNNEDELIKIGDKIAQIIPIYIYIGGIVENDKS